jgi:molecular chaperone HscB
VLGLSPRHTVDVDDLERRFRERSRLLHPDRFARATPRERRFSLERSTRLNDAYRTLRDPRRRAAYLLKLLGVDPFAEGRTLHDPEFLGEQLEIREGLAQARASGDARLLSLIADGARDRLRALDEEVANRLGDAAPLDALEPPDRDALLEVARLLARARYLENVLAEAAPSDSPHP